MLTNSGSFARRLINTFFFLSFLFGIFLLIFGFYITKEMNDFQERWAKEEKLLVLQNGGAVLLGITGTFMEGKQPHVLTESEKALVIKALQEKNEDLLLRNNYMAIIFTLKAFDGLTGDVTYGDTTISVAEAKELLLDSQPGNKLAAHMQSRGITTPMPLISDDQLKGLLFGLLFEHASRKDPFFFIEEYRNGTIMIFPERFLFTFMKKVPDTFYNQLKTMVAVQGGG